MRKYIAEEKGQKRSCGNALRKKVEKIKRENGYLIHLVLLEIRIKNIDLKALSCVFGIAVEVAQLRILVYSQIINAYMK